MRGLHVSYRAQGGLAPALQGISFRIMPGEAVGITGPSASGKTTLAKALLGLLPRTAQVSGSIRVQKHELVGGDERRWRGVRGRHMALVSQEPALALSPYLRVETHLICALRAHQKIDKNAARQRALETLQQVLPEDTSRILRAFPHQLSSGQRQRVALAVALAAEPKLLVADEPAARVDVVAQQHILALFNALRRQRTMALLLISHQPGMMQAGVQRELSLHEGRLRP